MNRINLYNRVARWVAALSLLLVTASCSTDPVGNDKEWVDPRYRNLKDSYTIAADGSDEINFEIKSNMEWLVYSDNAEWCTITPESGNDPETTYPVKVVYNPNTSLDDRTDTLFLKSDYWIFKRVPVTQGGIATLSIDKEKSFLSKEEQEANGSFVVRTNQNWRVEIAEDCDWLSFDTSSHTSEQGDGSQIVDFTVSYHATQNEGAQRQTTIAVYDRNDVEQFTHTVVQDGLLLTTNQDFYNFDYAGGEFTLPVNTNVKWSVELVESVAWASDIAAVNSLEGGAADEVTFTLSANNGASRAVYLRITSKIEIEGVDEVTHYVGIVQASKPTPKYTYFNDASIFDNIGTEGWYLYNGAQPTTVPGEENEGYINFSEWGRLMTYPSGIPFGRYDITLSDIGAAGGGDTFFFYLQFDNVSVNYVGMNINGGSYTAKIQKNGGNADNSPVVYTTNNMAAFLGKESHSLSDKQKLGIDIYKGDSGYLCYDWYIDDVLIQSVEGVAWENDAFESIHSLCFGVNPTAKGYVYSYSYTAPSEYDARPELPEK